MTQTQHQSTKQPQRKTPPETREANREFLARHPERGGRLPSPSNPKDAEAMAEWRALHAAAKKKHQPPTPKATPTTPCLPCQATKQECELESAEVECSHAPKRKFKVALPSVNAAKRTFDVIAGHAKTKESIKVTTKLKKPLCNAKGHKRRHIIVKQPHNAPEVVSAAQTLSVDVKSSLVLPTAKTSVGKMWILWKHLWPSYETSDVYYVDIDACTTNGPAQAIVRVFPDVSWSVEFNAAMGDEYGRKSVDKPDGTRTITNANALPLTLEAKASYKYDGDQQDISQEFKTTFNQKSPLVSTINLSAHWFRKIAYYAGNVKVTFPEMKWGFKYASSLGEDPAGPLVRRNVELTFAADPLLGASLKVDLLELLIKSAGTGSAGLGIACGPAIAEFLIKVKRAVEGGGSFWVLSGKAVAALTLGMSGGIGGKGYVKIANGKTIDVNGTVEGKIGFTFGGTASVEGKVWKLQATTGVSLTGSAGFAGGLQLGCDELGMYFGGKLYFSGAKLEFKMFYDVKIVRKPPPPDSKQENSQKGGWTVSWPAWPDEGKYNKHRFV